MYLHLKMRAGWHCLATGYGMGGPGIESWWGRDFPHLSKLALGGPKLASYTIVDHPPHLAPRLKKEQTYTSNPSLGLRGLF